jgi:hypothetical protein
MTDGPPGQKRAGGPGAGRPVVQSRDADLEPRMAALAAQVRALGERLGQRPAAGERQRHDAVSDWTEAGQAGSPAPRAESREMIIAAAETAAAEIRASAQREARRIRGSAGRVAGERLEALREAIARQRETLAGLTAETKRIEHSAAILLAQVRALESELQQTLASVDALDRDAD